MPRTIKLTLAYDGSDFAGWQIQADRRSLQAALEAAIERITGTHSATLASGRTDAGVHALGQVVAFRTESRLPCPVLKRALNAQVPRNMAVLAVTEAPDGFHPIRDAVSKRYRYLIHDGPVRDVFRQKYCWQYVYGRLDDAAMQRAATRLTGTHDFSSFESTGSPRKTSVRTVIDLTVERGRAGKEDLVTLEIEANGFLYNMVRAIVGTLVEVGRGAQPETWPGEVMALQDRRRAGPTAPAQGLFLVRVIYPEVVI